MQKEYLKYILAHSRQMINPIHPPLTGCELTSSFMAISKQSVKGRCLAANTAVDGSAGYVAIEEVKGVLNGRHGTFILQHNGVMNRGAPHLTITVVPDSATGQLVGLIGEMAIQITADEHAYEFVYTLPETA